MRRFLLRKWRMIRYAWNICIRIGILIILAGIFYIMLHDGKVWFNMPSENAYPIRGVDVSAHQGHIDWSVLKSQNISFAFIKATEGSSWVDKHFKENFENAYAQGLYVGAYHFFSFDSSGSTQAQNYIRNVPVLTARSLPPVVDVEFYGNKASNPPHKEAVYKELDTFLEILSKHYGTKPLIYTTPSFYDLYLRDKYERYPLWIRSVFFAPHSFAARIFKVYFSKERWIFWQYNPQAILKGYRGGERYIDLNVFNGNKKRLEEWIESNKIGVEE